MHRPLRRLLSGPALMTAAALLLAGCAGASTEERVDHKQTVPSAKPMTLEKLAAAVDCGKPKVPGKTLDYRQGMCKSGSAEYVLLTFDTAKGQREWLDVAQMYGGVYLVGSRWVLSATPRSAMEAARAKLGGTIEEGRSSGASPSAG
ncbi:hypothetical protein M2271_007511 [Streptomyces sp. LBL]|uniref:hypothetical protein n=1 Tax=Streptomyces sp. LBL TaxID=2940562 RepID=UPI0024771344|nr:hypothetical protein [Streptomyces sp. LBL]MDH6629673.1 hypothetical protein [Streptomyces sp. LBL]